MTGAAPRIWTAGPLTCRPITAEDTSFYTALFSDPAMVSHRPDPTPEPAEQLAEAVARDIAHWQDHGIGRYSVMSGDRPIGFCGLTQKPAFEGLNISYHIAPSAWGFGHASRLAEGLIAMARALDPAPTQVYGLVRPANPASAQVLEKHGFAHMRSVPLGQAPTDLWVLALD